MRMLAVLLCFPLQMIAQDINGVWKGNLKIQQTEVPYELVISKTPEGFKAFSLTTFDINGTKNRGIKSVQVKIRKSIITIEDDKLIYDDYQVASKRVKLVGKATLEEGVDTVLAGTFITRSSDRSSFTGAIRLVRQRDISGSELVSFLVKLNLKNDFAFLNSDINSIPGHISDSLAPVSAIHPNPASSLPEAAPALKQGQERTFIPVVASPVKRADSNMVKPLHRQANIPVAAAEFASRKTEIIRTILFSSDSLVLSLYDNGEIDGDTVSVLINGNVIIAAQGLNTTPIRTKISTVSADSILVAMYAENLGRISPNTGLLIIQDGNERHEIRFEGDFKRNSAVVFRRKR